MQTNGTLLNKAWLSFLTEHFPSLQLGISCDGPSSHDALRQDYQNRPSLKDVESAFRLCESENINIGVICVVTRSSLERAAETAKYFAAWSCIKAVKLVPCFDYSGHAEPGTRRREKLAQLIYTSRPEMLPWAITAEAYTRFLASFSSAWQSEFYRHYILEPDITIIRKFSNASVNHCHYSAKKCGHVLTLYPDGQVGACDELCKSDIGLIPTHRFNLEGFTERVAAFSNDAVVSRLQQACQACDYYSVCGGGCIATRRRLAEHGREAAYCQHRITLINNTSALIEATPC
ncbi:radical SAM protein [Pseudomonas sp. NBRC 111124]|uniref:radical SAM protein n=1 Tax=Pseudomonas sp. NBRC 111124 TaxID=1661039 RepID=UPI0015A7417C|nr:SPASM domain-containing protein [Pseudomonas sp. NBRC 111124]